MRHFSLYILIVFFFASVLHSADVNEIIEHIQETYDELDNLSAAFRQTDTFRITGSRSETAGKIYIKDGLKYRFESEDQVIVTDGETVWTYNSISKQLLIDRVRKNSGALLPRDMLFKYPKTHHATLLKEEKKTGRHFMFCVLTLKRVCADLYGASKSGSERRTG